MMSTGSTGSLFNIGSAEARPLSAERVREEAFAMPIHGPMFGRSPGWFLDRPALTVTYRTAV
jgi:acetoacetate decarboxylase